MPPIANGISSTRRTRQQGIWLWARTSLWNGLWRMKHTFASWWRISRSFRVGQRLRVAPRLIRFRTISILLLLSSAAPAVSAQIYHDPHRKTTVGFSVDLNTPPDTVLQIVKGVASDLIIPATSMSQKA